MPLQRRPQIPVERPRIVPLNPKAQRVHHADQFLRLGIAGARKNLKHFARLLELPVLHQIARRFHFRHRGASQKAKYNCKLAHLFFLVATPAVAEISAQDYIPADPKQAQLGQLLFYDKILSGNRNISCGTCHHHDHAGTDGLSLGIGEGGVGVGPNRTPGTGANAIRKRIPRNAPALWNLGHKDIRVIFHDGRLTASDIYGNGFNSPAQEWLPKGLDNLVAAQALLPLTAQFEMAGNPRENEVAGAIHDRIDNAWPIIAKRVRTITEYGEMFVDAFDHIDRPDQVTIVEIGNALAAFITTEWRSYNSPYDDYLKGKPLPKAAARGLNVFFTEAQCASCHSGPLFTDQEFHALGLPAFGPGRTRPWDPMPRDVGRMGKSDLLEDAYKFRTPSLRNVALTGPYGHNGAYPTLEAMIRHHLDPEKSLESWTIKDAKLPEVPWLAAVDTSIRSDAIEMQRQKQAIEIAPFDLSEGDIQDLIAFLNALTDKDALNRPLGRPKMVPSGLPVD